MKNNGLMSFDELAKNFHLEKFSRAPARFDKHQLLHWQKEAVMALDADAVWEWLGEEIQKKVPAARRKMYLLKLMRQNICFPHEATKWAQFYLSNELPFS